jgi:hypothetical protein
MMNSGRDQATGGRNAEKIERERQRMELSRAEKLKLWQSSKHSSGGSRKNHVQQVNITTNPLRKQTNIKPILFKKKNFKKFSSSSTSSIQEETTTRSENDFENACPNERATEGTKRSNFSTPVKNFKILSSTHHPSPFVDLDGYVTANEEDQLPLDETKNELSNQNFFSPSSPIPLPINTNTSPITSPSFLSFLNEKLTKENSILSKKLQLSERRQQEAYEVAKMSQNEIECLLFANDVLTQKSLQIEEQLTKERMRYREKDHQKVDKYKEEIRSLKGKNSEYERRANEMVAEMNLQMSQLQDMAMTRIEVCYHLLFVSISHSSLLPHPS